ncbi:MAG: hydroxyacylglutathione hydrolase [Pseudobdellovibrionaceae bacterium]
MRVLLTLMEDPERRVELLPIFKDNYVFVVIDKIAGEAIVIDPGEAAPVKAFLISHELPLKAIYLTHHHSDHIDGAKELKEIFSAAVYAPLKNKKQMAFADHYVKEGDTISTGRFSFSVMELPGHTLGHVGYFCSQEKWLFSGDVVFGLGCGRVFEGTYEQMYHSIQRIKALPSETLIFCTHEYTEANLQFCKILKMDENENFEAYEKELTRRRKLHLPSVPLKLSLEKKANPFLLTQSLEQFSYLRDLKNKT